MEGKIKRIISKRGFGFIEIVKGNDIFFHCKGVVGVFEDLKEGDQVNFEIEKGQKGPRAIRVKLIL